jgi:hypothetical protein
VSLRTVIRWLGQHHRGEALPQRGRCSDYQDTRRASKPGPGSTLARRM